MGSDIMQNIVYESHHDKNKNLKFNYSKNANIRNHFHRSYELIYVTKGVIEVGVGPYTYIAKENDFIFVNKYYTHYYKSLEEYEKYVLIIPPYICNDFEMEFKEKTLPPLLTDRDFNMTLLPILKDMQSKFKECGHIVHKGYINIIIGELINHYKLIPIKKNSNIELLMNILDYIDQNYNKDLSLESIATEFGYSKYYLSRLFNDLINENLNNYVNIIRVQHASNMINESTDKTIAEIAYECGFNSLPTFYRCYKKVYDVQPTKQ